jgi:hypothetical protein
MVRPVCFRQRRVAAGSVLTGWRERSAALRIGLWPFVAVTSMGRRVD